MAQMLLGAGSTVATAQLFPLRAFAESLLWAGACVTSWGALWLRLIPQPTVAGRKSHSGWLKRQHQGATGVAHGSRTAILQLWGHLMSPHDSSWHLALLCGCSFTGFIFSAVLGVGFPAVYPA